MKQQTYCMKKTAYLHDLSTVYCTKTNKTIFTIIKVYSCLSQNLQIFATLTETLAEALHYAAQQHSSQNIPQIPEAPHTPGHNLN